MLIKTGIPIDKCYPCITWAYKFFETHIDYPLFREIILNETNWEKSAMLVDDNDRIFGLYLIGDRQLNDLIPNNTNYKNKVGVQGVLLAVDNSLRGQGWGNKLKDYPKTLGFDYIWGEQLKTLNNLKDWLKRRKLVAQTEYCYITLEEFNK